MASFSLPEHHPPISQNQRLTTTDRSSLVLISKSPTSCIVAQRCPGARSMSSCNCGHVPCLKTTTRPFASHQHLYATIDTISLAEVPWQTFSVTYNGAIPGGAMPSWMIREYDVWFRDPRLVLRNQYGNPDFARDIDWAPKRVRLANGKRQYCDFMSGDWAWSQAVSFNHKGVKTSAPKYCTGYPC